MTRLMAGLKLETVVPRGGLRMQDPHLTWEEAVCWLRQQPDQKTLVDFCYYDDPVASAAQRFEKSEEWAAVLNLLRKTLPGRVLDLGAGRGISTFSFARGGSRVAAVEPNPSLIVGSGAIRELGDVFGLEFDIVESVGETLPFSANSFDVVYCRAVLHHAANLKRLVQEVERVLRPGGLFLATREHVISHSRQLESFLMAHPLHSLYGGENAFLLSEYKYVLRAAGLEIVKTLGPFDSPINFFPASEREIQMLTIKAIAKYLGSRMGHHLGSITQIQLLHRRFLSWQCDIPGRLYTFLARKP